MAGQTTTAAGYNWVSASANNGGGTGYDQLASVLTGPPGPPANTMIVTQPAVTQAVAAVLMLSGGSRSMISSGGM